MAGVVGKSGDQAVGEQQDGRSGDGGEPGGQVEEPLQGVDVEQLGGDPAAEHPSGDADQAGEYEALCPLTGDEYIGDQTCGQAENDPCDDAHDELLSWWAIPEDSGARSPPSRGDLPAGPGLSARIGSGSAAAHRAARVLDDLRQGSRRAATWSTVTCMVSSFRFGGGTGSRPRRALSRLGGAAAGGREAGRAIFAVMMTSSSVTFVPGSRVPCSNK